MPTKLSALAANLAEYGWLAALVVVPVFFDPHTARIFEEDKVYLLRSLAALILVGLVIRLTEEGRAALRIAGQPFWRLPMVKPAAALTACYLASTAVSIAPSMSFWGAYVRAQGACTWLSYVVVFAAVILLARERRQVERLVTVALLASVPVAVYGVIQHFGLDPIPWGTDVTERVQGTAGNAIFISAYLIMVAPLTLARLIAQAGDVARLAAQRAPLRLRLASGWLLCAYALVLALQLLTIVYSQSRGPFLGLIAGLAFFFIVFALHRRLRWLTIATASALAAGGLFLIVFNLPHTPLEGLRATPYIGRLGQIADVGGGTGRVRVLMWDGAVKLLADAPERGLLGYGPETLFLAYRRFYSPELAHYERRGTTPDRSHNETFDALIMTGAFGLLAQLAVFVSFFAHTLRWLGMIRGRREGWVFFSAVMLGGGAGVVAPYYFDGGFRLAGVGLPAGMAAGLLGYLIVHAMACLNEPGRGAGSDELLLIGLLAAVMAHFVEVHFGIAIAATRLYFWTYASVAVVVGVPLLRGAAEERGSPLCDETASELACHTELGSSPFEKGGSRGIYPNSRSPKSPLAPLFQRGESAALKEPGHSDKGGAGGITAVNQPRPLLTGNLVTVSPIVGLILALLTFSFYRRGLDVGRHGPALAALAASVWLTGALVIAAEPGERRDWLARLIGYAATTIGVWMLFVGVYKPWADRVVVARELTPEVVEALALHRSHGITILYAFVFLVVALTAVVTTARQRPLPRRVTRLRSWKALAYAGLLGAAGVGIDRINLASARADTFAKQGTLYEQRRQWEAAATVYEHALRLQPEQDRYALGLARVRLERARRDLRDRAAERTAMLEAARAAMERAEEISPLDPDHPRGLAKVHRAWALFTEEPAARAQHVALAEAAYERATALSPNSAALWNEWATFYSEQRRPERALAILDHALQVDPRYTTTHWLRAETYAAMERWADAVANYDRALDIDPSLLAAWSGKALALARLGRTEDALAANLEAVRVKPNDLISHRNLALLYRQTGDLERAMQEAETALALATGDDRPPLERFIEELRVQSADHAP